MVEFGEKVKKLREEKGMTQQTMADKLYVTRQAVSRWECGARFPDLLTAKKIAQILEVSVDELLSGEELKKSIERDPVLSAPVSNMIQTILYAVASAAYLLMLVFSLYSFYPAQALKGTPAGKITAINVITAVGYLINLCALAAGLVFSARNSLSAAKTGIIDVPCGSHGYDNKTERPYGPVRLAGSVYSRIICGMYPCIFQQTRGKAFSCHYLCDCRRVVH